MNAVENIKKNIPLRTRLKSARLWWRTRTKRRRMQLAPLSDVCVSYGLEHVPTLREYAQGGMVKFQWMQTLYPNSPDCFNTLYMVSSQPPEGAVHLGKQARKIGARLVWNQNGVAYPGWYGWRWKERNRSMADLLHKADYVFFQSKFCQMAANEFLGQRTGPSEVLYNPVDTFAFSPPETGPEGLVLLLAGNQYQFYRLEAALKTLALVRDTRPEARLIVTGKLNWLPDPTETSRIARECVESLGITEAVTFHGPYLQSEAPDLFRNAHILLHTRYNDPCPTVVLEALASGLPVVHSESGGVPELVGKDAGIGIPAELSWEREVPPDPEALAEAVLKIAASPGDYSAAARRRAVDQFDLKPWLERHRQVFESLL